MINPSAGKIYDTEEVNRIQGWINQQEEMFAAEEAPKQKKEVIVAAVVLLTTAVSLLFMVRYLRK